MVCVLFIFQIFADMAALVDAQREDLDNIENLVRNFTCSSD
jgi:hypothetical protein